MKYLNFFFAILIFTSCEKDNTTETANIACMPLTLGNSWNYVISDSTNKLLYSDTDSIVSKVSMDLNGVKQNVYKINNTRNNNFNYSWYLFYDNNNIWFYSDSLVKPLMEANIYPKTFWVKLSLCIDSSFQSIDEQLEEISIIINGQAVQGKIKISNVFDFKYTGISTLNIQNKNFISSNYYVTFHHFETLIEPTNVTFIDSLGNDTKSRIRNDYSKNLTLQFASGIGFISFNYDNGIKRILSDYKLN